MTRLFFVLFLVLLGFMSYSQYGLSHHYTFNNCNGQDLVGGDDGLFFGLSNCPCGVDGFALEFKTSGQFADFHRSINDELREDFTFSFYMWPRSSFTGNESIELWSIGKECSVDSIFQIRYFPIDGTIRVNISDQPRNAVELEGLLLDEYCWSYVAVTKEGREYKLFIDKIEVDRAISPIASTFQSDDILTLSLGPCASRPGVEEYEGLIDELRIYDRALTSDELELEDFFPDQIIEDKIVLFKGESAVIETGGTCSDDFEWSPSTGLTNTESLNPVATPESSMTYTLSINYNNCLISDQIDIIVVDVDELDCDQLLLPSAFTPNGDGLNDMFGISNGFILEELLSFEIYDKWGGRLFFTADGNSQWNGSFRNKAVMPGPYVYRVKYICGGEESIRNGVVNVIR